MCSLVRRKTCVWVPCNLGWWVIFGKQFPGLRKGRASQTTNQHSGLRSFYRHTYVSQVLDAFLFFFFSTLMNDYFLSNHHFISPWWAEACLCSQWLHICMLVKQSKSVDGFPARHQHWAVDRYSSSQSSPCSTDGHLLPLTPLITGGLLCHISFIRDSKTHYMLCWNYPVTIRRLSTALTMSCFT